MGALVFHNQLKISLELFDLPKSKENGCASRQKLSKKRFGARKYSSIRLKQKWVHQSLIVMPKSSSELDGSFFEKWLCPTEKIFQLEKIFKFNIFVLKYVLNHSKSIPTKKNFRKIFDFLVTNFSKKRLCPRKKNFNGKKFSKSIFSF